jgi:hypothetical protein
MSTNATSTYLMPEQVDIMPYASFVAIGFLVFFFLAICLLRLLVKVDNKQSDLILFNKTPQKHLLMLVSNQLYNNSAASNNIAIAIAHGLMEAPPNYDMSKVNAINSRNSIDSNLRHNSLSGTSTMDTFDKKK